MEKAPESKSERFKRIASYRTNEILKRVRLLAKLANNGHAYAYSDQDVRKIFRVIDDEIRLAKARFQSREAGDFNL